MVDVTAEMSFESGFISTNKQNLAYQGQEDFVVKIRDTRLYKNQTDPNSIRGKFNLQVRIPEEFKHTSNASTKGATLVYFDGTSNYSVPMTNQTVTLIEQQTVQQEKDYAFTLAYQNKQPTKKETLALQIPQGNTLKEVTYQTTMEWHVVRGP